jgi:hypothetical protein
MKSTSARPRARVEKRPWNQRWKAASRSIRAESRWREQLAGQTAYSHSRSSIPRLGAMGREQEQVVGGRRSFMCALACCPTGGSVPGRRLGAWRSTAHPRQRGLAQHRRGRRFIVTRLGAARTTRHGATRTARHGTAQTRSSPVEAAPPAPTRLSPVEAACASGAAAR